MGDLFTYRLRMIYGKWCIFIDGMQLEFENYFKARDAAKVYERQGYIDGDR